MLCHLCWDWLWERAEIWVGGGVMYDDQHKDEHDFIKRLLKESYHARGAEDSKIFLSAEHEELAQHQHQHQQRPKHGFEGIRSHNPTNSSMR